MKKNALILLLSVISPVIISGCNFKALEKNENINNQANEQNSIVQQDDSSSSIISNDNNSSSEDLVSSSTMNNISYSSNDYSSFVSSYNDSQSSSNLVSSKEEIPLLPDDEKQKDEEPKHLFDDFFGKFSGVENDSSLLFSSEQEISNYFLAAYEGLTITQEALEKRASQATTMILKLLPANFFDYYNLIFTSTFIMPLGVNDLFFDGLSFENGQLQIYYLNNPNKIISNYPAYRTYFDVFSVGKNQTIDSIEVIGYCSYERSIDDATYTKTVFTNE